MTDPKNLNKCCPTNDGNVGKAIHSLSNRIKYLERKNSDIENSIDEEISRAIDVENTLQQHIEEEQNRASIKEEEILLGLNEEQTRAEDAELTLSNKIDEDIETERNRAIDVETTILSNLTEEIDARKQAINNVINSIPEAQILPDWNLTDNNAKDFIKNKPHALDGKSAYELAVDNGFEGTELEWLASLKGSQGIQGEQGPAGQDGSDGTDGQDGAPGLDGHSPVVTASKSGSTTTIYVDGISIVTIEDGLDGQDGQNGTNGTNGTNGLDGVTPHIDSISKHWMIGSTDTGIVAEGQTGSNGTNGSDGVTPHIDSTTGNWFIGTTDTGVHALGPAGLDGSNGTNGSNGQDGNDGTDGITPTVTVTAISNGHKVAFDYGTGDSRNTEFNVMDGNVANQLQADWNLTDNTQADYIKNKPTIPDAQILSSWSQSDNTAKDYIKNKPTLEEVATSGDCRDLYNADTTHIYNNSNYITSGEPDANGYSYTEVAGIKWGSVIGGSQNPKYFLFGYTEEVDNYTKQNYKYYKSEVYNEGEEDEYTEEYNIYKGNIVKYKNRTDNTYKTLNRLSLQDDVVHLLWGGDWRLPTIEEIEHLVKNTTITENNYNIIFEDKLGNELYLPKTIGIKVGNTVDTTKIAFRTSDKFYASKYGSNYNIGPACLTKNSYGYTVAIVLDDYGLIGIPVIGVLGKRDEDNKLNFLLNSLNNESITVNNNNHPYIDLGLPSGTLWSTMNIGATDDYEVGDYCEYKIGYDVATLSFGGDWTIPSEELWKELLNSTNCEELTILDQRVLRLTSKHNGNYILIPLGGLGYEYNQNVDVSSLNEDAYYWSSTPSTQSFALVTFNYYSSTIHLSWLYYDRGDRLNIRPVITGHKNDKIKTSELQNDRGFISLQPESNGHDYVEIGGIKWATMNVGATRVTDVGLYFQWGDTLGYKASQIGNNSGQKAFSWTDYKFRGDNNGGQTKYNTTDGLTTLELTDDAVQANWGGMWRMPTKEEIDKLLDSVDAYQSTDYNDSGVDGYILRDKTDYSKLLFIPYSGNSSSLNSHTSHFWSSTLDENNQVSSYILNDDYSSSSLRYFGLPVRGVLDTVSKVIITGDYNDLKNRPTNISLFTNDSKYLIGPVDPNNHEFVDLGLPSGTLWAKYNVGATSETATGNYYMWGKGSSQYNSSDSAYSGDKTTLSLSMDAAYLVMGGSWHTPTKILLEELIANTTYEWTTINGVNGGKYTASNGNYIFLPAAGSYSGGTLSFSGTDGYYLSSDRENSESNLVYSLSCDDNTPAVSAYSYLTHGCSVRGVMDHESNKVFKVAITGDYNDLINKPTIPTSSGSGTQIQADWNQSDNTQADYIKNKPTIPQIWRGTQALYDLLTPDNNTIYIITSAS